MQWWDNLAKSIVRAAAHTLDRDRLATIEFFETILDTVPTMVHIKHASSDLKYFYVNRAGEELLGIQRAQLIGRTSYDTFPREIADRLIKADHQILNGAETSSEIEYVDNRGEQPRIMSFKKYPLTAPDGRGFILTMGEDVTARRELERQSQIRAALEANELLLKSASVERFELAFAGSNDGVWDWDIQANRLFLSLEWIRHLGYETREIAPTSQGIGKLIHPNDRMRVKELFEAHLEKQTPFRTEARLKTKSGDYIWVLARGNAVQDPDGIPTRFVGILTDITERKRMELELQQAKENALRAAQAKAEFLANMSHEIRTPLNVLVGMTDVFAESPLNQHQRECVNSFKRAGDALLLIVNDVLDLSKIEAGKFQINRDDFNLPDLIDHLVGVLSMRARAKGLTLEVQGAETVPAYLHGDKDRLGQVLMNLLSNAIKFTERGRVCLRLEASPLSTPAEPIVKFSVTDTGIGIPNEKMSCLFSSFSQIDPNIAARFGGTGLGLTISKKLVNLMGGDISVDSEVGRGSTFSFVLKFEAPQSGFVSRTADRETIDDLAGRKLKVLLADDSDDNRLLIRSFFTATNSTVREAENGALALELFKDEKFDIVLMDIHMPVMDGYSAIREIRRLEHERNDKPTPVLALTAYALRDEADKCLTAGADRHLPKPIKKNTLFGIIASLIDPSAGLGQTIDYSVRVAPDLLGAAQGYLEKRKAELEKMSSALEKSDFKTVNKFARNMRTTAPSFGLNLLAEVAGRLEISIATGEKSEIETGFSELRAVLFKTEIGPVKVVS